ncbi:MAG: TIGR03905 family TSCPD domain-containing protein [Clostridia bacterium]|nr:TIGR03905 family TSCPD domain-containing protein [Clostridia bacterium]
MKDFTYKTRLVCSRGITFSVEDGVLMSVKFSMGCPGSLQGIGSLVEGMAVVEVIRRLKGIDCMNKGTSCPDQLAKALEEYVEAEKNKVC